jgi:hypothetical protein
MKIVALHLNLGLREKVHHAPVLQRYGLYPAEYFLFQRV